MERFLKSRYRIGSKINESPYSLTYKGTFLANDTPLVIKIYKRGTLNSALIQVMKQKVKEFAALEHPNIARLYDGDYGWQGFYYVRQYISGTSLADILKVRKKLDLDYAISLLLDVSEALVSAHSRGIVHGGLKPTNIFIDQRNQVKVTDFIIEGSIKEALPQKAAQVLSDKTYLSPEELTGSPAGASSDIFMMGLLLHEMLTGQPYFSKDKNYFTTLRKLKFIPQVPKFINDILYRALQEDPLVRFDSIGRFQESLQNKNVVAKKDEMDLPQIKLEDLENPEAKEIKVIKEERSRSFLLLLIVVASIIAGLLYAILSLRF